MSTLDPNGPAAMLQAATGTRPMWANDEQVTTGSEPSWTYGIEYVAGPVLRELLALNQTGWRVSLRSRSRRIVIRFTKGNK